MTLYDTSADSGRSVNAGAAKVNPYVGPRPFEWRERTLFFGREREARDLISLIVANQTFVLYSPSGAGKTSLLNTKVVAGLKEEGFWILPIARVQGKLRPEVDDSVIGNIFSANALMSLRDAFPNLPESFCYSTTILDFMKSLLANNPKHDEPIVLIFDQFEELCSFYEYRWAERTAFIQEIIVAQDEITQLRVVFSLREDYIAKLDAYNGYFPNRLRARYQLERLQQDAAIEAVVGPLGQTGKKYGDEVARLIVQDLLATQARDLKGNPVTVKGAFVEPVQLQVVCANLWDSVPATENVITAYHLAQSGNVDEALRKFYDATVSYIVRQENISEKVLRRWFDSDLITSAGTRGTVFRGEDATAGMPNRIVATLENRHLIRGDWRAGAQWYEITHDRLLRPIRESNRIWFKRRARLRSAVLTSAVVLSLGSYAWFVRTQQLEAARQLGQAEASALGARLINAADSLPASQLDTSLLLAVEAVKVSHTAATQNNLLKQILRGDRILRFGRVASGEITNSVYIPGTDLIALATTDRNVLLWNYRTGGTLMPIWIGGDFSVNLFADSERLYVMPDRADAQVFSVRGLADGLLIPDEARGSIFAQLQLAIGRSSAKDSVDPANQLIGTSQGGAGPMPVAALAGERLVTRNGNEFRITEQTAGQELTVASFVFEVPEAPSGLVRVENFGISPDGKVLFAIGCRVSEESGSGNASAQRRPSGSQQSQCVRWFAKFWMVDQKREIPLSGFVFEQLPMIAVSHFDDSIWVATKRADDRKVTIRRANLNQRGQSLFSNVVATIESGAPLSALIFSGKEPVLVSASAGGSIVSWKFNAERRLQRKLHEGYPVDLASSLSGALAAVGPSGLFVYSSENQQLLSVPSSPKSDSSSASEEELAGVSLAPDGHQLLVARDSMVELFAVGSAVPLFSVNLNSALSASVALDPRGRYAASGYLPLSSIGRSVAPPRSASDPIVPILWQIANKSPIITADLSAVTRTPPSDKDAGGSSRDEQQMVIGVVFSREGRYFAMSRSREFARNGSVLVYKRSDDAGADTFRNPITVQINDGVPYFLAFSGDSKKLAVTGSTGGILLLNPDTGSIIMRLNTEGRGGGGRESGRVAFSPDGRFLAASIPNAVQLWDLGNDLPISNEIPFDNTSGLVGMTFTQDSKSLITGDAELNSVVAFDLSVQSWIKQACDIAGRDLTAGELKSYGLALESQRTCLRQ